MQTFLPYEDFFLSADVMDKKRCWKQVLEADYIIKSLQGLKGDGWSNHPAVKMWDGYVPALMEYYNAFLITTLTKHKIKTLKEFYDIDRDNERPWWLGNENFHRAMRSRLIEKNPEFYLPLFPEDRGFNESKYFWPVMHNRTFRVI